MTPRAALAAALLAGASALAGAAWPAPQPGDRRPDSAAWAIVDWSGGAILAGEQRDRLERPAQPGSLMKVPVLAAALASGLVTPATRVPCAGEATVDGHLVRCSHPRLRHPLRPAEALAVSCNVWFATIGARLPRARLDGVLTALGLPPTPREAPMALAATGMRARPAPPLAWVSAVTRLLGDAPPTAVSAQARQTLLEGLRGAALYGTASAFGERGVDALAKTGTAEGGAGGAIGIVVAAWPAAAPTRAMVLLAPGIAGRDAADLAAAIAVRPLAAAAAAPRSPATIGPVRGAPAGAAATSAALRIGTPQSGGGYAVTALPLEEYVGQVLAGEAAAASPEAALETLAIVIRTFALANRGRHQRGGFDLCTTTHCQVLRPSYDAARRAASATAGQVLLADGGLASPYYTASCGGRTERPSSVWPGAEDPSYLPSKRDRACRGEPRWAAEIPVQDLERALAAAGVRGTRLRELDVDRHTASGRVALVRLEGLTPDHLSGQDLRMAVGRTLGWHLLKSTRFRVRRVGNGYRFDGDGFGHGVGLCVIGSVRRAEQGDSVKEIVKAYFPGAAIGRAPRELVSTAAVAAVGAPDAPAVGIAPPPVARPAAPPPRVPAATAAAASAPAAVAIQLPASAEPDRAALTSFVRTALADLARVTGRPVPAGVRVVFHPSAESFRRETHEPWWSAARTAGTRVDLLPLPVLRARGTVESTLRHELAHLLTGPVLDGRPEWVREGVAMHFAGEPPPSSLLDGGGLPRRVRCPSDADLRQPVSAAAARQAYGLAAACVARALFEGKAWSELR